MSAERDWELGCDFTSRLQAGGGRRKSSVVRKSENHSVTKKFSTEIVWRQTDKHAAAIYVPAATSVANFIVRLIWYTIRLIVKVDQSEKLGHQKY